MNKIDNLQNEITEILLKYSSEGMYSELIDVFIGNGVMLAGAILYDLNATDLIEDYICRLVADHAMHTKELIKEIVETCPC